MPLTIKEVKHAKPGRHSDGKGLYLLVKAARDDSSKVASASWVLRVQRDGERRDIGLGAMVLDSVGGDIPIERRKLLSLAEAREKARIGRALAKAGINPSDHWRALGQPEEAPRTFRAVAKEVHAEAEGGWKDGKHKAEWLGSLERYAFPLIGDRSVTGIDASAIHEVLLPIWLTVPETARRVKQRIGVVLDHAHAKGWRSSEAPMRAVNQLMRRIRQPKAGHFAAMPYGDLPAFVERLTAADSSVGRLALQFLILTAARPGEVRNAKWSEIDLEAAEWRIPPERMKAGKAHIVPLVPAAVVILKQMRVLFGSSAKAFVFPGFKGKALSDATLAKVLRVEEGTGTAHGLRSAFRDWAAEKGFNNDWAEAALAHTVAGQEGKTVAAYKRTTFFDHRRDKLMPAWAGFVLSDSTNVVSLVKSA
jgi:integrase